MLVHMLLSHSSWTRSYAGHQYVSYLPLSLSPAVLTDGHTHIWLCVHPGNENLVIVLAKQLLFPLSHLPKPHVINIPDAQDQILSKFLKKKKPAKYKHFLQKVCSFNFHFFCILLEIHISFLLKLQKVQWHLLAAIVLSSSVLSFL